MAKVVRELVTKWVYKVDTTQVKQAAKNIKGLRGAFSQARKASASFSRSEMRNINRIKQGWKSLSGSIAGYKRSAQASGMFGGSRGKGTGRASLSQSGAFLAGRLTGSTALTSALLGGGVLTAGLGVGSAIKTAATRESKQTAFTTLLKSGEKAKQLLDDLTEFGKTTPFEIPQLRDLSEFLLAGEFKQSEIIPTLRRLGDVTGGSADKLNRLIANMIEIRGQNKAYTRDIRQFTRAGVAIMPYLRQVTGATTEEVWNMASKGKISFDIVNKALILATSNGGLYHDRMKNAANDLIQLWSNLKDSMIDALEKGGMPILESVKSLVRLVTRNMGGVAQSFGHVTFAINAIVMGLRDVVKESGGASKALKGLVVLGVALSAAFAPTLFTLTSIYLVLDDIGTFLQNGDSLIGRYLEDLKGVTLKDIGTGFMKFLFPERETPTRGARTSPAMPKFQSMKRHSASLDEVISNSFANMGNANRIFNGGSMNNTFNIGVGESVQESFDVAMQGYDTMNRMAQSYASA